jgi:hypothetical protein
MPQATFYGFANAIVGTLKSLLLHAFDMVLLNPADVAEDDTVMG